MTTQQLAVTGVSTQANVYFDGKCVSHSVTLADGSKKSVGVVLPSQLTFKTGAPEVMECVAGGCEYKLAGSDSWQKAVPARNSALRPTPASTSALARRITTSATSANTPAEYSG